MTYLCHKWLDSKSKEICLAITIAIAIIALMRFQFKKCSITIGKTFVK